MWENLVSYNHMQTESGTQKKENLQKGTETRAYTYITYTL